MSKPEDDTYPGYLKAKASVDERSLHQRVWDRFLGELTGSTSEVRLLEVGAGTGTTAARILDALSDFSLERIEYTLVDIHADNVEAARAQLRGGLEKRARQGGGQLTDLQEGGVSLTGSSQEIVVRSFVGDLFHLPSALEPSPHDAIVAQAVFDLMPIADALQALRPHLAAGGVWYLPIHFDGVTAFEPAHPLDSRIERLYHASMTENIEGEELREAAHTGRRLLTQLRKEGGALLDVGSSDWVVFGGPDGYAETEDDFLHHILSFIETELAGHPALSPSALETWIQTRRRQIEDGELIYIAHQLDVLARQR